MTFSEGINPIKIYNVNGEEINPATNESIEALGGLLTEAYDSISFSYPSSTEEIIYFKVGGLAGVTVMTITVTYTDATKENVQSAVRT